MQAELEPGIDPHTRMRWDVLAALIDGCPIRDVREWMFDGCGMPTLIAFRIIADCHEQTGSAPSPALFLTIVEQDQTLAPSTKDRLREFLSYVEELRRHPSDWFVKHFDENLKELREAARRAQVSRFLGEWRDRVDGGIDLEELSGLRFSDAWDDGGDFTPVPVGDLLDRFTSLRESIISGVGRRGEVVNIISAAKAGKTWLTIGMALCAAAGMDWLGHQILKPRNVLLLDNELHEEDLTYRIKRVAEALMLNPEDFRPRLRTIRLRCRSFDVNMLSRIPGPADLVTLDSLYKFTPSGTNENDNTGMRDVYERLLAFAEEMNAMVAVVHHTSKGGQTEKGVTDVGSGAGSISRAADTHLILRPHREDDCAVMESRCRSYEPQEPRVLRFTFPVWSVDESLSPNDLKNPRKESKDREDDAAIGQLVDAIRAIIAKGKKASCNAVRTRTGWNDGRAKRLIAAALRQELIEDHEYGALTHYTPVWPV